MINWLLVLVALINLTITAHIFGIMFGKFIAKVIHCFIGVSIYYTDENETYTFKYWEAWLVQSALEDAEHNAAILERDIKEGILWQY